MEQNRYSLLLLGVMIISLVFGVIAGVFLDRQILRLTSGVFIPVTGSTLSSPEDINFDLIREAWNTINRIYVDRDAVVPRELTYGAISGMVEALGDTGHSRFLTPEMVRQENSFTEGEFEGIGIEVEIRNEQLVVVAPIHDSPAQKAGLQPGDIILKVNGEDITGLPIQEMITKIKGPVGTLVNLTVLKKDTQETKEYSIERERIPIKNVDWATVPGTEIAHIRIAAFTRGVGRDLTSALEDARARNLKGVVLDLRNNPGGLLEEAINIASQFLESGEVMQEKDASGNTKPVPVRPGGVAVNIPLVVLVNQGSASASEIVAGAMQDAGRAKLVGEKTFGTGTVLNQFNLSDGSALLLATEEWLTPNGRVIWHTGIDPDFLVELPGGVNPLGPVSEESMSQEQLAQSQDEQLFKALELLGSPVTAEAPTSQP